MMSFCWILSEIQGLACVSEFVLQRIKESKSKKKGKKIFLLFFFFLGGGGVGGGGVVKGVGMGLSKDWLV